ncbi:hypothetical protein BH23ACT6_BH23ACT6_00940 [soil metagenome]
MEEVILGSGECWLGGGDTREGALHATMWCAGLLLLLATGPPASAGDPARGFQLPVSFSRSAARASSEAKMPGSSSGALGAGSGRLEVLAGAESEE